MYHIISKLFYHFGCSDVFYSSGHCQPVQNGNISAVLRTNLSHTPLMLDERGPSILRISDPPPPPPPCISTFITSYTAYSKIMLIQGGSNMTGTDLCVNKCKHSRSYLNHPVHLLNKVIWIIITLNELIYL